MARRVLKMLEMEEDYEGNVEVFIDGFNLQIHYIYNHICADCLCYHYQATGEDYSVEPAETRRPFRALLDVGLIRTTTGNRVFGALKVLI